MFAFLHSHWGLICTKQWCNSQWGAPSPLSIVADLLEEAMTIPPVHLKTASSLIKDARWSLPQTLTEISEWTKQMSEDLFQTGSVIEKFVYVYSLVMVAGPDGVVNKEWCLKAIEDVKGWLFHLM